jgi:uncharacterized membrane protein YecN with MAPEG domain
MTLNAPLGAAMIHAALLLFMTIALAILVIRQRRRASIGVGDGGDKALARAIRAHGNFAENAPFAIGAYILLALGGASATLIHVLGAIFLAGRVAHAAGLSHYEGASVGRGIGVSTTFGVLAVAGARLLMFALE